MDGADESGRQGVPHRMGARPVFRYRTYGLCVHSELRLPELEPDDSDQADVTVRLHPARPLGEAIQPAFQFGPEVQQLTWPVVGSFRITGDHTIDIEPGPEASEQLLHLPLLGPITALVLHLRGFLVLHGSAIRIGDRCAIFLGDKGAGKSTTAAALLAAGHQLMTDDLAAIDFSLRGEPRVSPGFPQIKLDKDLPRGVALDRALILPEPIAEFPKRLQRLTDPFSHRPLAPTRIYVLERGEKAEATPLPAPQALTSLMRFAYVTRFATRHRSDEEAALMLRQTAMLSRTAQVCRLEMPTGLESLPDAVRFIEQDLAATPRKRASA